MGEVFGRTHNLGM